MFTTRKLYHLFTSEKILFFLILSPFLYMAVNVVLNGFPDMPNSGDAALLELSTRNVFSQGILLGPYSRFIFFHPGPLYFQIRFPFYELMGERNSSLFIVTVLIQVVSLFLAWRIVRKLTGSFSAILFSASAALFLLNTDKTVWLSEWNPYIIILPFMLYTVSMAAFASGRLEYLITAAAAGSLAAQTHISVVPSMAAVALLSAVVLIYPWFVSGRRSNQFRAKPFLVSLGLLLLLWGAPLYQQFFPSSGEGNMTRILNYFRESSPELDTNRAFAAWSSVTSGIQTSHIVFQRGVILFRLILLSGVYIVLRKRKDSAFLCTMALISVILHWISWYSVTQIRGELNAYLIQWISVVPFLSVFTLMASAVIIFKLDRFRFHKAIPAVFLLYAAVVLTAGLRGYYRTELHPSWENEIAVRELSMQMVQNLNWDSETFYVINLVTTDQWPVMFGLLNSMEKTDLPVGVEDNLLYIPTPVPEGMHSRTLHLGILNEQGLSMPGLTANWNGIGLILQ